MPTDERISAEQLAALLCNQTVTITSVSGNGSPERVTGTCVQIHVTPRELHPFDVRLSNGSRYAIDPTTISDTAVEGVLFGGLIRRTITLGSFA